MNKYKISFEVDVPDHITETQATHDVVSMVSHIGTHPLARRVVTAQADWKFEKHPVPGRKTAHVVDFPGPDIGKGWKIKNVTAETLATNVPEE